MEPQGLLLRTFPGKYGLPTLDPHALIALTYSRFGGADLKIEAAHGFRSYWKLRGRLPVLIYGDRQVCGVRNILSELRELGIGTDYRLSTKESADAMAFIALMEEKLVPAVLHTLWLTEKNYEEICRSTYATAFRWLPMRLLLPGLLWHEVRNRVLQHREDLGCCTREEIEEAIYQDAKECLDVLATKLDSQNFLFGSSPTSADAYMVGLMAPILQVPFPKNRLLPCLRAHANICDSVTATVAKLFPSAQGSDAKKTAGGSGGKQEQQSTSSGQPSDESNADSEYPHRRRNIAMAGIMAVAVMITYALATGIVQIDVVDRTEQDGNEDDQVD